MPLSAEEEAAGKPRGVWGYDMCEIHNVAAVRLKAAQDDKMELVSPNAHSTHKCQPQDHNDGFNKHWNVKLHANLMKIMLNKGKLQMGVTVADDVDMAEAIVMTLKAPPPPSCYSICRLAGVPKSLRM